jgi:transposase
MDKFIGFDIDNKKTIACVVHKGGKDRFATLPSKVEAMRGFLQQEKGKDHQVHLTFEISGEAGFLHDELIGHVDSITVSNPTKMTWIYRTAKKNDRLDARKQAVLLSIGEIPKVHMPTRKVRQWRQTILHRRNLIARAVQVKNRIRALLKSQGFRKPLHRGSWWKATNRLWMTTLSKRAWSCGQLWRMKLAHLLEELQLLETQLSHVTAYLDRYLATLPGATLLMTIPGVGPRTAEAVLAYTDDVRRFRRGKQYCAYFGLTPKLDESGSCRRLGHINKQGPSVVRWLAGESAWRVIKQSPAMKAFYEKVLARREGRKKIAVVAVARKLLSIMRAMLLTGECFNEELVCHQDPALRKTA